MKKGKILFYEGRWNVFNNFSAHQVYWRNRLWATCEHAYQAAKFFGIDEHIVSEIFQALSAHDAKKIARKHNDQVRPDWHDIKLGIMEEIVRAKLEQHSYIKQRLLATGQLEIIEDSPRDNFWGRGPNWDGQNHLGKIWMKLRTELRTIVLSEEKWWDEISNTELSTAAKEKIRAGVYSFINETIPPTIDSDDEFLSIQNEIEIIILGTQTLHLEKIKNLFVVTN